MANKQELTSHIVYDRGKMRELYNLGYSDSDIAEVLGCVRTTVHGWRERNKLPNTALIKIRRERKARCRVFGKRLKALRTERGLSQLKLAEELHMTQYSISAYERSEMLPGTESLTKLAEYFDVSPDWLLGKGEIAMESVYITNGINRKNNRAEYDYYATDPKAVEMLLELERFNQNIGYVTFSVESQKFER